MLKIQAPAKVNLVLKVLGRRADGFHDLFMVMERLSLYDDIALEQIASGIELRVNADFSDDGMLMEKNLAWRAAKKFIETTGEDKGVRIHLDKKIPIAAGLGGGSSDAAAVLKGLNIMWNKGLNSDELAHMGAALGADVPFFCYNGTCIAEGIGDRISAVSKLPKLYFLLINPGFSVSTPWVYIEFDKISEYPVNNRGLGLTQQNKGVSFRPFFECFEDVVSSLENDLEKVTAGAYQEVFEIKKFLDNYGANGSLMSGSGPTVFGVFKDAPTRDEAIKSIPKNNWKAFAAENI